MQRMQRERGEMLASSAVHYRRDAASTTINAVNTAERVDDNGQIALRALFANAIGNFNLGAARRAPCRIAVVGRGLPNGEIARIINEISAS